MGLFSKSKKSIDDFVAQAQKDNATLIDVRDASEFEQGHIPGAINIPLRDIATTANVVSDKGEALYVYCTSGVRSRMASTQLRSLGFANATNIGGISAYHGPIE